MTLRKATILLTCLGFLGLMAVVAVATHFTIEASFASLEREQALRDMDRARNGLDDELRKLDEIVVDWAVWDDSNNFMRGRARREFIASNLNDRTLASLHLSAILFLDRAGNVVWGQGFDSVQGRKAPMPLGLLAVLGPDSAMLKAKVEEERARGLLLLPGGPALLASCPILDSEGKGAPTGTLVMLRPLSTREGTAIAQRLRLPAEFERADSPPDPDIAGLAARAEHGPVAAALSDSLYGVAQVLPDILGRPAVRVVLRETRDIRAKGSSALGRSHLLATAGAFVFLAMLLVFLERRVLRRVASLREQVEGIGAGLSSEAGQTSLPVRVVLPGSDELSALAERVNEALAELERSRRNLSTQCVMTLEQEGYLQQIVNSIQAGVILVDPETRVIREVNAFAAACAGRSREEIAGRLCHGFVLPGAGGACPALGMEPDAGPRVDEIQRPDGTSVPVLRSVSRLVRAGQPLLLETFIDVSELQQAQEALRRSEETYRALFMHTGTATMLIDADTTITLANQEFEKLSGYSRAEIEGKMSWTRFFLPEDTEWMMRHHAKRRQSPGLAPRNYEARFVNRRGEVRVALLTVGMMPGTQVSVAAIEDITERKNAEEELRHLSLHDTLTGLPNRQLLLDRLGRSVESARREGGESAVLLMDLDRFKDVNDSLGHTAGDQLLKLVGERLEEAVRRSDTVARLGGDEFVIVVEGPGGGNEPGMVATHVLQSLAAPFELDGRSLHIGVSIGIAVFPGHGDTPEVLLKNADMAMYRAKERGRNTYEFYTEELNTQMVQRLAVETGLRRALAAGGIEVFYQPKVRQPGSQIVGVEALVRWRREDGTLVSPAEFIPVAENTGLILPLSELVLRQACAQVAQWRRGRHKHLIMAVNLSPRQFAQPDLVRRIRDIVAETGVEPQALEFEITENLLLDIRPETLAALHDLRDMGASVVLDDFGKEYSSLGYIKRLPIQAIKIDRSFVDDLPQDEDDAAIVQTILAMARNLELRVVAEGVETEGQLEFLTRVGCTEFQGYYFSKPLPALDMGALLDQGTPFAPKA